MMREGLYIYLNKGEYLPMPAGGVRPASCRVADDAERALLC